MLTFDFRRKPQLFSSNASFVDFYTHNHSLLGIDFECFVIFRANISNFKITFKASLVIFES